MADRRKSTYWQSYRRVRSNVQAHISAIYTDDDDDDTQEICDMEDICSMQGNLDMQVGRFESDHSVPQSAEYESASTSSPLSENCSELTIDPGAENETFEKDLQEQVLSYMHLSDSDVSEDDDPDPGDVSLENELKTWASSFQIPHSALQSLLSTLRVHHPFLPKDPRTLLKTSTYYNVIDIDGGSYFHFGIASSLLRLLQDMPNLEATYIDSVLVQFNIDGLPLFKSTNAQLWPILSHVIEPFESKPSVVGLFSGNKKPGNVQQYLQSFKDEVLELMQNAMQIPNSGHKFGIQISCFICDTPARAFVKQS